MAHSALAGEVGEVVTGGGVVEFDEGGGELRGVDRACSSWAGLGSTPRCGWRRRCVLGGAAAHRADGPLVIVVVVMC
ncbi:MAG: hypothetical protein M3O70_02090 [Actinomycetota bacterium]|nr:hypothetical protein [Actinomycetota bacterium]